MATKALVDFFSNHLVDGEHGAAGGAQGGLEAAGRHRGVGVEPDQAFLWRGIADRLDVFHRVAERDGFELRRGGLLAHEIREFFLLQRALDRAQTIRPLRMPGRRQVIEAGRMGHQQSRHV